MKKRKRAVNQAWRCSAAVGRRRTSDRLSPGDLELDQRLGPGFWSSNPPGSGFACGSGDENKESGSVLWPEERRRCGGRNARSWEPRRRQSEMFSPAGVPPLQPENISSPFPRPEAVVPLRAAQLSDPSRLPGVRYAHLKGTERDVNLIPNRLAGTFSCRLFDCRLVVRQSHTRVWRVEVCVFPNERWMIKCCCCAFVRLLSCPCAACETCLWNDLIWWFGVMTFFFFFFSFSSAGTSMPRLVPAAAVYRHFSLCCVRASVLLCFCVVEWWNSLSAPPCLLLFSQQALILAARLFSVCLFTC